MIIETLGRSGVRVSELCDLKLGDVRFNEGWFRIVDAKTEAGVREVQMTPDLAERFGRHITRIRAAGRPTGVDDYAFPNIRGGHMSRERVGKIVSEAATEATETMKRHGLPPLPNTTPHTLRRTHCAARASRSHSGPIASTSSGSWARSDTRTRR